MKRRRKFTLGLVALSAAAIFVSGCTANFCTNKEKSRIAYAIDTGTTEFVVGTVDTSKYEVIRTDGNVSQVIGFTKDKSGNKSYVYSDTVKDIRSGAKSSSVLVPSRKYFQDLDYKVYEVAISEYNKDHKTKPYNSSTVTKKELSTLLDDYGYFKFYNAKKDETFGNFKAINAQLRKEAGNYTTYASIDFENYYISTMESLISGYHSSITVYNKVKYGSYGAGEKSVWLEGVTWKDAWGKGGHLIEGLIVYPVAWMIDSFAIAFAGGRNASPAAISAQYQTGVPQILAILIVTVIVRMFIFLCTFKSTLAQRKMTELQPELAKIQQKYPNANTNQAQKQRLAEEQMRLYKKHKVNPLSQLLVLVIQFPIFIGVWGAMTGSAVLSTGKFLGLHLSASIWETLKMGPKTAGGGWWTAFVLIILMSAGQFFAMKVPQWIQKARTKKVARLGKNPAQKQQNRTANIVSYAMLIMIIIMGFTLPAAMGVYWFVGAIVSLIQTVFTTVIFGRPKKKNN